MKIGIIGAGHIGGTLTKRLTALGHDVSVANSRGPETLTDLAGESGARPVMTGEAARSGEVVVISIPLASVRDLPPDLFEGVPDDVVVVDTGNYYPRERDGRIEEIEAGMTESRWVATRLRRPVVKAFNTIYARKLMENGRPAGASDRLAIPVAGDRERDKSVVLRLVDELGFDGIDAGELDGSWRQQPGTPVYGADLDEVGARRAIAEASPERKPEFRADGPSHDTSSA